LTSMGCFDWEMVHLGRWIKIVRTAAAEACGRSAGQQPAAALGGGARRKFTGEAQNRAPGH
jgi:hypothetical protein